jgi:hypothetical protein
MSDLIKEKVEIVLCNSDLEAKLIFTTIQQAEDWARRQTELHGKAPDLILARRVTRIITEVL